MTGLSFSKESFEIEPLKLSRQRSPVPVQTNASDRFLNHSLIINYGESLPVHQSFSGIQEFPKRLQSLDPGVRTSKPAGKRVVYASKDLEHSLQIKDSILKVLNAHDQNREQKKLSKDSTPHSSVVGVTKTTLSKLPKSLGPRDSTHSVRSSNSVKGSKVSKGHRKDAEMSLADQERLLNVKYNRTKNISIGDHES